MDTAWHKSKLIPGSHSFTSENKYVRGERQKKNVSFSLTFKSLDFRFHAHDRFKWTNPQLKRCPS